MARLSSYDLDANVSGNDKIIGTDTSGTTKNYSLSNISNWLNDSGQINILGQNNYFFQETAAQPSPRLEGSVSFESFGGAETSFSGITSLIFSSKNAAGISNEDFITGFIGKSVLIAQLDDYNEFGVYELSSFSPLINENGFYKAILSFKNGSGSIKSDKHYGLALYEFSAQIYERSSYPVVSPNGTSFIIVAGNDGTLAAIPPDSTAPSITSVPTISGTLNVGETLTATAGNVSGVPTPTQVLQWQRSDNGTTGWADIAGAMGTTYLLAFNDEDKYIRVEQTEENILGTATANSASTTQIQPTIGLLLDLYPNSEVAYSLRRLSVSYSGSAIRVTTNGTDSAEIGFVNNELDTASLEAFAGSGDAYVSTWFDQSGNGNDATSSTFSSMPKIVSNGTSLGYIETTQGGATQLGTSRNVYFSYTDYSVFFTAQNFGGEVFGSVGGGFFAVAVSGSTNTAANSFSNLSYYKNGSAIGLVWGDMYNATTSFSQISALATRTGADTNFRIGFSTGTFNHGRYKEYIIYPNQSVSRTEVEDNIITHYRF
jgi:hypothetical protein